jgi:hypothetical protein
VQSLLYLSVSSSIDYFKKTESKIDRGLCWVYLGMIQSTLLRPLGNVDPVEETNIKVDVMKHQVSSCDIEPIFFHQIFRYYGHVIWPENSKYYYFVKLWSIRFTNFN